MNDTYKWHEAYKAAVLETDWSKMNDRIRAAESALQDRKRDFLLDHGGTADERQAIADAVNSLSVLRMEVAAWTRENQKVIS
jgi:hypothetical protein